MVITQAAKEKASVFLKGEASVQRHRAPNEAQGRFSTHEPLSRERRVACQSLGCPGEELGRQAYGVPPQMSFHLEEPSGSSVGVAWKGSCWKQRNWKHVRTLLHTTVTSVKKKKKIHAHLWYPFIQSNLLWVKFHWHTARPIIYIWSVTAFATKAKGSNYVRKRSLTLAPDEE